MSDVIKDPEHYEGYGGIECKDALESAMGAGTLYYWWGCAFKYLWRWRRKNGIEDLEKCKQCIDYLIEVISDDD